MPTSFDAEKYHFGRTDELISWPPRSSHQAVAPFDIDSGNEFDANAPNHPGHPRTKMAQNTSGVAEGAVEPTTEHIITAFVSSSPTKPAEKLIRATIHKPQGRVTNRPTTKAAGKTDAQAAKTGSKRKAENDINPSSREQEAISISLPAAEHGDKSYLADINESE